MANSDVEVYTEKLRLAGLDNAKVHTGLLGIVADAEAAFAVGTAAWGDDKFGAQFAEGPQGFKTRMKNIIEGAQNIAKSYEQNEGGQFDGSKTHDGREGDSERGFLV